MVLRAYYSSDFSCHCNSSSSVFLWKPGPMQNILYQSQCRQLNLSFDNFNCRKGLENSPLPDWPCAILNSELQTNIKLVFLFSSSCNFILKGLDSFLWNTVNSLRYNQMNCAENQFCTPTSYPSHSAMLPSFSTKFCC